MDISDPYTFVPSNSDPARITKTFYERDGVYNESRVKCAIDPDGAVSFYSYEEIKEPRTPETGHTPLLPGDEQVVTLPMDNGWSQAIEVGKLPDDDERPVVMDMDPAADPVLFWAGKRNRQHGCNLRSAGYRRQTTPGTPAIRRESPICGVLSYPYHAPCSPLVQLLLAGQNAGRALAFRGRQLMFSVATFRGLREAGRLRHARSQPACGTGAGIDTGAKRWRLIHTTIPATSC